MKEDNKTRYIFISENDSMYVEGENFVEAYNNLKKLKETSKLPKGNLYVKCADNTFN